jgi:hypothetical protein
MPTKKQWNPDAGPKEREEGQKNPQNQDPRERPEIYDDKKKPAQRVVTGDPQRKQGGR